MFVVFDHKSIIFIIIAMIIVLGSIAYFLRDCNCKTGPQGPQGLPGQSMDMSNYIGNVNVTGDIKASGKIKAGECELNCTPTPTPESSSSTGWIIAIAVLIGIIIVSVAVVYFYIYDQKNPNISSSSTPGP